MMRPKKPPSDPFAWITETSSVRFAWWASLKTWSWLIIGTLMMLAMAFVFAVRLVAGIALRLLRR